MHKLYYSNRKNFHKLKNIIETIERSYPAYSNGIMTKIDECEKRCGEITEIKMRNRAVASCLDNVLIKWTKVVFEQEDPQKQKIKHV